ncbi:IclR family transcriptional regulator (plasmid) [Paracoccus denitrificans]|jgi:DNA-binding IclR family transcriptional regulator|uniref:Transcriptional regulator, IclR family n=2 Tax=Paracoccus denitrificans TaxID=266 RepID=A1BBT9_PARDP|nr:transcriptional regulator, IclR family [Paracoccus denitrificans PD1222]QAR29379.1 IclR family transcriptional regulator [Paracoccus denitrificans]GEK68736.1 IclR family transcriptional regulator [Paracoccus denitrificans]
MDGVEMDADSTKPGTQSLSRVFTVLEAVRSGCADLASIGRHVGTGRSTTHRLVSFLVQHSYLRHIDGRGYVLGPALISLGSAALEQMPLTSCARPHIEQLAHETGDSIHLSIREGDNIIYVDKIPGTKGLEMRSRIGLQKPMATTGTGKVQLFDLPEQEWLRLYELARADALANEMTPTGFLEWDVFRAKLAEFRDKGFAIEREENEVGICCVAAPIRDARGKVVAGVSVASSVHYMSEERLGTLVAPVMRCAEAISAELGWCRPV